MMNKFKSLFTFQTEFQKYLLKSSLLKDNYVFKQEDLDNVIPYFSEPNNPFEFFQLFQDEKQQSYPLKMKLLIVTHYVLSLSEEFTQEFQNTNLQFFFKLNNKIDNSVFKSANTEGWLMENIETPFLQYLQKIAMNIEDIRSYRNHHFRKQIIQSNLVIDCFKLENLVNHGLSLVPCLKTALSNFPHDFLLKRLACSLYSEIRMFQKQLINSLSALLDANSQASNIEIYEFFREVQLIEKKMMQFYMMHKLYDPARKLMPPLQLKIDIKSAKHLEQQAQHEQQKLSQIKQQKSQRICRAQSSDFSKRVQDGFISNRERKFQQHSRAKKQETIQEDIEIPTEEQQKEQNQFQDKITHRSNRSNNYNNSMDEPQV